MNEDLKTIIEMAGKHSELEDKIRNLQQEDRSIIHSLKDEIIRQKQFDLISINWRGLHTMMSNALRDRNVSQMISSVPRQVRKS